MEKTNFNYLYEFDNGEKKTRDEAIQDMLNFIGSDRYSMNQIAKGIGLNYTSTTSLVRWAKRNQLMYGIRRGRKYYFGAGIIEEDSCLLAKMFYDKEKILSHFKIIDVQKRKVDDAPNKSIIAKGHGVVYNQHVLDTVYD